MANQQTRPEPSRRNASVRFLQSVEIAQADKRTQNEFRGLLHSGKIIHEGNRIFVPEKIYGFSKLEIIQLIIKMRACILAESLYVAETFRSKFLIKLKG